MRQGGQSGGQRRGQSVDISQPRFRWKVCGADVNDEIRSLGKAASGFIGQLVRRAPLSTAHKQTRTQLCLSSGILQAPTAARFIFKAACNSPVALAEGCLKAAAVDDPFVGKLL